MIGQAVQIILQVEPAAAPRSSGSGSGSGSGRGRPERRVDAALAYLRGRRAGMAAVEDRRPAYEVGGRSAGRRASFTSPRRAIGRKGGRVTLTSRGEGNRHGLVMRELRLWAIVHAVPGISCGPGDRGPRLQDPPRTDPRRRCLRHCRRRFHRPRPPLTFRG